MKVVVVCLLAAFLSSAIHAETSQPPTAVTAQQISPAEGQLNLAALKGHVAYIDFWASWCGPCRQSFPWMMDMQQRFAGQGLVVVAIDVDKDRVAAADFLNEFRPAFPIVYDSRGALAERYHIVGMPSSLIVDRDGRIHFTHTGFRPEQRGQLEHELQSLLY